MALRGGDLMVYGGGNYCRDYVYITDVVNALLYAGITPGLGGQVYNVASGVGTTVREAFHMVASQAVAITKIPVKVNDTVWPTGVASIELRDFTADISKYSAATHWRPVVSLNKGIALLIAEYMKKGSASFFD